MELPAPHTIPASNELPQALRAQTILFFDGHCNLCSRSVQWILKRDKQGKIKFAPLQGITAAQLLGPTLGHANMNSVVLWQQGKVYTQSTAALQAARMLDGGWPALYALIIVPPFIRNAVYNFIARHRYRWFGRHQTCWLPRPEWTKRFLD